MPAALAASTSQRASPTATVSSAVVPALRGLLEDVRGRLRVLDGARVDDAVDVAIGPELLHVVFQLFVFGAGNEPDLVASFFERGDQLLRPWKRVAVLLHLLVELGVEVLDLLYRLLAVDELVDQKPRAFTNLPVELDPRHPVARLLERPRPRLRVQVVRVHQSAVNVKNDHARHEILLSCLRIRPMKYLRVPQNNADSNDLEGYTALHEGAAVVDRSERRLLRLTGKDPVGMLNAVLTNEVPAHGNLGTYAMLLNPKGRVKADLRVVKAEGETLIDTEPEGAEAAEEILGRYAPFSRVKLEVLPDWRVLGLYGPQAAELTENLDLTEHETKQPEIGGASVLVVGVAVPVGGYDLIGPSETLGAIRERLVESGAVPSGHDAYETARIEAGVPRFGADITPENFPGESENALQRAVNFGKGCYPGQETVARMHYRGSPNKMLYRFELEPGPTVPPEAGDEILQGEKELAGPASSVDVVGRLTSVAPSAVDGKVYALGYLARKADLQAPMRAEDAKVLAVTRA